MPTEPKIDRNDPAQLGSRPRGPAPAPRRGARHRARARHQPSRPHRDDPARVLPRLAGAPPRGDPAAGARARAAHPRGRPRPRPAARRLRRARRRPSARRSCSPRARSTCCAAAPRGEEKLLKNARDEVASEALEIAIYDALEALATALGDEPTAKLAARHRAQEERMLAELRAHIPHLAHAVVQARAGGRPSFDWETTGAADAARPARRKATRRARSRQAADRRLRVADRERGRLEALRLHAGAAAGRDRLRARAPQARHGDRARAEPAGERAVRRLRRADRARGRAAAARLRRGDGPAACASTRGATSAASRCSRPPQRQLSGTSS